MVLKSILLLNVGEMANNPSFPPLFVTVDTETRPDPKQSSNNIEHHIFDLGIAFVNYRLPDNSYMTEKHRLDKPSDFHKLLNNLPKQKKNIYIFAHNAGFDSRILQIYSQIEKSKYYLTDPNQTPNPNRPSQPLAVFENPPFLFKFYNQSGQAFLFSDTVQLFFSSIKSLGESLSFPKLEVDFKAASREEMFVYCERDVHILNTYLIKYFKYLDKNNLGSFMPTLAGQAMHVFRRRLNKIKIIKHDSLTLNKLERQSYYGGRLEVYRHGFTKGPIYKLDVNSLYPYVMKRYNYPIELTNYIYPTKPFRPDSDQTYDDCIAHVTLDCSGEPYPVRLKNGVSYITGSFQTVLSGPELARASKASHIVLIHSLHKYNTANIFSDYVQLFWDLKRRAEIANDKVGREIAKRLLVSLYGKFAQRDYTYLPTSDIPPISNWGEFKEYDENDECLRRYRVLNGDVSELIEGGDCKTAFTPIAAFVTAFAREHMVKLRSIAGYGNYYYQATDSLFVSQAGHDRLVSADEISALGMGKLKNEGTINELNIHAYHRYEADEKKVRGGVRGGSKQIDDWKYQCDHFQSLKTGLKAGLLDSVQISKINKDLSLTYSRAEILPDGFTRPYHVIDPQRTPTEWRAVDIEEILSMR